MTEVREPHLGLDPVARHERRGGREAQRRHARTDCAAEQAIRRKAAIRAQVIEHIKQRPIRDVKPRVLRLHA